jgi:tRNA-splicing ligase RtcB
LPGCSQSSKKQHIATGSETDSKRRRTSIMPKGKKWTTEECFDLAMAWIETSEDDGQPEVKGTNQDSDEFWAKVMERFKVKGPTPQNGIYGECAMTAIQTQFKDNIARDLKKFNKSLLKVMSSNPSGVSQQEKINIAVAMHLGKTDAVSQRHKNFEPMNWKLYQCWLTLKEHRAFQPPQPQSPVEVEDDDADEEDEEGEAEGSRGSGNETETGRELFATPTVTGQAAVVTGNSRQRSRGPGPGAKKTKSMAAEDEYRKKKQKYNDAMLQIHRQHQQDFNAYVNNMTRAQAFKMALSGYQAFKEDDPAEAFRNKQKMQAILSCNTAADKASDMPPLFPDRTQESASQEEGV